MKVALFRADDQPDVGHQQKDRELQERFRRGLTHHQRHQKCTDNSEYRAGRRADQPFQADLLQADLEEDDAAAK